jgi:hypothetical protein
MRAAHSNTIPFSPSPHMVCELHTVEVVGVGVEGDGPADERRRGPRGILRSWHVHVVAICRRQSSLRYIRSLYKVIMIRYIQNSARIALSLSLSLFLSLSLSLTCAHALLSLSLSLSPSLYLTLTHLRTLSTLVVSIFLFRAQLIV